MRLRLIILLIALLPAPAFAADERRLSPAEVERILEAAALKREQSTAAAPQPPRAIEGEVELSIGSGGYRAMFGTAIVPVGTDGVAIISMDGAATRRDYRRPR